MSSAHLDSGSGSGGFVCGRSVRGTVASMSGASSLLRSQCARCGIRNWLTDVNAKASDVDVAVAPDEESAKDGLGENVEDTIEDSFRVRGDDIATFRQAPGDGVQEPKANGPDAANGVDSVDVCTECDSVAATLEDNGPGDEEEGDAAEDVISPLVGAVDQGTDQASDNHDLIDQDCVADGWRWKATGQEKVKEQQGCCKEPYPWSAFDRVIST